MSKIEQAVNYTEELLEATRTRPERLLDSASSTSKWKTIYQKLLDLYLEENKKEPKCSRLKCASHLLDKLVQREHLNTLVVNLYPGNEGYSLLLKGRTGADSETMRLPYEESELLNYIDAEQLPPLLVDLLDKVQSNIFYCGCVIAEVRDHRRSINNTYDTRYVLLRPTPQTLLCDINAMTSGNLKWTTEDKLQLESQLLLHINEPLCLDPTPAVCLISNRFNYQKYKLNHHALKRAVNKYSQTAMNKKQKLAQSLAPKHLKLHNFLNKRRDKLKSTSTVNLKVGKSCVDMWRQRDVHLNMPENIEVEKYAKLLEKPKVINDNTPIVVEEYTFETERSHGKVNYSKLTIMQRMNEEFYLGQLYVDRDYVEGKSQGSTCKFALGTKANVEKYIRQFREIFTEEGRRQVKISHLVPGQRPVVSYTQTVHAATTSQAAITSQQSTIVTQPSNLAAAITGQIGIGISGTDSTNKKATPIRLSLSLNPQPVSGSTASTQVTPVTAQLTLNLQQQQQLAAAQRIRQMNIYQGLQRSASSGGSQASTPTNPLGLITMTTTSQGTAQHNTAPVKSVKASICTPTGTPTPTPTCTSPPAALTTPALQCTLSSVAGLRRLACADSTQNISSTNPLSINLSGNIVQASSQQSTGSSGLPSATPPPNVNIANITSAPPNINIQDLTGLQGVNIATNLQGLQNLHNVQVSLGGVNLTGGIAVPVPITPTGILVRSIPGVQTCSTNATTSPTGGGNITLSAATNSASLPSLVTMVTAVSSSTTAATVTSVAGSNSSGLLQLPIGVTGNLTQFMAGIKSAQGIRPGTPVLLSQIAGHPGQQVQLLSTTSLNQARSQGATHTSQTATLSNKLNVSSPASTTTTQSIGTQPTTLSTLTQLQATAGQPQMLTTQQLVQQQQKLTAGQVQQLRQQQSGIILTTAAAASENKPKKKKSLATSPKSS
ncbi:hypothetical protein LSH36_301g03046 [Paralvinella palmiformis]|uniref:Spt20-like SEP domain-containing protein n=1 Tax=Paralvinella palmiformis TaxID=53620 RepID=A0AAD9JHQ4_9ANNE|nr:hypothetical protein LSH36_301g03046 [Paralvinella palmiformis]